MLDAASLNTSAIPTCQLDNGGNFLNFGDSRYGDSWDKEKGERKGNGMLDVSRSTSLYQSCRGWSNYVLVRPDALYLPVVRTVYK